MQRPLGFFNVSSTFTLLTYPWANCLGFKLPSLFAAFQQIFLAERQEGKPVVAREMYKLGPKLSYDDDSESVAKKMNLRSFKLNGVYWTRSICQMQAIFTGVEFVRILFKFKKRKENSSSLVHVLHKTANYRKFHVVVVQSTSKKFTHVQSWCFEVVVIVVVFA